MRLTDIFYVTYRHDLEWFQWSLHTVKKNLTGYRKIVAVAPEIDRELFERIEGVEWHFIPDWPGKGYLWQQWVKIQAWKYTDAELICHIDSDVMVAAPLELTALMDGELPCWMWQYYSELPKNVPWQPITEKATGLRIAKEYMRAFPFIIDRATHQEVEEFLVERHAQSLMYMISNSGGFSEFNAMGAIAEAHHPERYSWFNTGRGGSWPDSFKKVRQHWSHEDWQEAEQDLVKEFGAIPILTDFGVWIIPGDTHLSAWIREHQRLDFDIHFLEEICQFIKPGDTVVDVGAFVGDHTLAYAHMTSGHPGRVLAFEPNPLTFACLKRNMNQFGHVQCYQHGLSDKTANVNVTSDPNWGGVYLEEVEGGSQGASGSSVTHALDSFKLFGVSLIKIDAEGYEVKVLQGAEWTIRTNLPILVIEINKGALERQGTSEEELREVLASFGYEVFKDSMGLQYDIYCRPKQP